MLKSPDHKAIAIQNGEQPVTELERKYANSLTGEDAPFDLEYAISIYEDSYKAEVLEAFLLTKADYIFVEKVLKVPRDIISIYAELFFDKSVFKDELDIESYVHTYPDEWGKEIKVSAVVLGKEYLAYRFGHDNPDINIIGALKSIIENSYMLSKATKLNPLDSDATREARQWSTVAIKAMEAYAKIEPTMDKRDEDFYLAMENIDRTVRETVATAESDTKLEIDKIKIVH